MHGWRNMAACIATSGGLAWAVALYPFGVAPCVVGGVCGAVVGVFGAHPVARLADRASAEGGVRRWSSVAAVLVVLWLALVILPSIVGAAVRSQTRSHQRPNPALSLTRPVCLLCVAPWEVAGQVSLVVRPRRASG